MLGRRYQTGRTLCGELFGRRDLAVCEETKGRSLPIVLSAVGGMERRLKGTVLPDLLCCVC